MPLIVRDIQGNRDRVDSAHHLAFTGMAYPEANSSAGVQSAYIALALLITYPPASLTFGSASLGPGQQLISPLLTIMILVLCSLFLSAAVLQPREERVLHTYHPRTWYMDCLAVPATASWDGAHLLFDCEGETFLLERASGGASPLADYLGWDSLQWATWGPSCGVLFARGIEEGEQRQGFVKLANRQFIPYEPGLQVFDILFPKVSGLAVVFGRKGDDIGLWQVADGAEPRLMQKDPRNSAWAVSADGRWSCTLTQGQTGRSHVRLFDLVKGTDRVIAEGLDASYQLSTMAFSADASEIFLSLVGSVAGSVESKQAPASARDLDIFALSLTTGELRIVIEGPGDDLISGVGKDEVLWTRQETSMQTVAMPIEGGAFTTLSGETSSFPAWHPDGDRVTVMHGAFHLADWALNWDIGVLSLDPSGAAKGELETVVAGNHEDFGPAWSPDGRWLAYHSHRSPRPAVQYHGNEATDDIWMRPAQGGEEILLTKDAGLEVCQPHWAPSGNELVFVAIDPKTHKYRPVLVRIDPDSGAPLAQTDLEFPWIKGDIVAATFSPSGHELAMEEKLGQDRRRLWIAALDGDEKRLLAEYVSLPAFSGISHDPAGESLYFTALEGAHHQLFRVRVDGTEEPEQLTTSDVELFTPRVSPDGTRVAMTAYRHTKTIFANTEL